MLKSKLKDYIKEQISEVRLPWKLGGIGSWPQEQKFDPFIQYDRLLNEEKVIQQIHQLTKSFALNQISEYQSFLEHSLARHIRNEMYNYVKIEANSTRINHQNYKFELTIKEILDIQLFNVTNVFRTGVSASRHANKQDKLARFEMKIGDKDFQTFFNKRPQANDKAIVSMWLDIAFQSQVQTLLSGSDYHYENDAIEIHTLRYEIDVAQSEYKSVKQDSAFDNQWLKDLKFNLQDVRTIIVDIDNYANGNEFIKTLKL